MLCVYETTIIAVCPVDDRPDVYHATFEADRTIQVENIIEEIGKYRTEKTYQEDITAALARALKCKVTTVGHHSGVKTTVVAP